MLVLDFKYAKKPMTMQFEVSAATRDLLLFKLVSVTMKGEPQQKPEWLYPEPRRMVLNRFTALSDGSHIQ